jgi:hypothetical protein
VSLVEHAGETEYPQLMVVGATLAVALGNDGKSDGDSDIIYSIIDCKTR